MFGIGTPELIFIFLIGFFIFGPRQLPEIGRRLGEIMAQLRRAADEFKQTWEAEVESERARLLKAMPSLTVDLEPVPSLPADALAVEGTLPRTPTRATSVLTEAGPDTPVAPADITSPAEQDAHLLGEDGVYRTLRPELPPAPSVESVGYEG